jgi:hypothetical protein
MLSSSSAEEPLFPPFVVPAKRFVDGSVAEKHHVFRCIGLMKLPASPAIPPVPTANAAVRDE